MVSVFSVTHFRLSHDIQGEDQQGQMINGQIKTLCTHRANTPSDNLSSFYSCAKTRALQV